MTQYFVITQKKGATYWIRTSAETYQKTREKKISPSSINITLLVKLKLREDEGDKRKLL